MLHVIAPGPVGGAESVVAALAGARHARGAPTHVAALVPSADAPLVATLRASGVPVHAVVCGHRRYLCEVAGVARVAGTLGAQVIHTHVYRGDFAGYFAARRLGLPVVATYHGHIGGDWRNRVYEWMDRRLLARFDAVACVSTAGRDRLRRAWVPAQTLHVVQNGHRPPALFARAEARERLRLTDQRFTMGWVGRLSHEKGADLLLEALAAASAGVRAVIVGDGPERERLEAQARALKLPPDTVRFEGQVPSAAALFRAFDALVISSRTEGLPMVLLEAMSAGVPVIAFAVGGIPEVVSNELAWLATPGEPAALASAIEAAARDPDAVRRRAVAAQAAFSQRFD